MATKRPMSQATLRARATRTDTPAVYEPGRDGIVEASRFGRDIARGGRSGGDRERKMQAIEVQDCLRGTSQATKLVFVNDSHIRSFEKGSELTTHPENKDESMPNPLLTGLDGRPIRAKAKGLDGKDLGIVEAGILNLTSWPAGMTRLHAAPTVRLTAAEDYKREGTGETDNGGILYFHPFKHYHDTDKPEHERLIPPSEALVIFNNLRRLAGELVLFEDRNRDVPKENRKPHISEGLDDDSFNEIVDGYLPEGQKAGWVLTPRTMGLRVPHQIGVEFEELWWYEEEDLIRGFGSDFVNGNKSVDPSDLRSWEIQPIARQTGHDLAYEDKAANLKDKPDVIAVAMSDGIIWKVRLDTLEHDTRLWREHLSVNSLVGKAAATRASFKGQRSSNTAKALQMLLEGDVGGAGRRILSGWF